MLFPSVGRCRDSTCKEPRRKTGLRWQNENEFNSQVVCNGGGKFLYSNRRRPKTVFWPPPPQSQSVAWRNEHFSDRGILRYKIIYQWPTRHCYRRAVVFKKKKAPRQSPLKSSFAMPLVAINVKQSTVHSFFRAPIAHPPIYISVIRVIQIYLLPVTTARRIWF